MPSRLATAAILLFWLATTSVLVYRELAPRFQTGDAPPFTIPLTAEVGQNIVNWNVLQKGERIGSGFTQIKLEPGRIFKLSAEFKLERIKLFVAMDKVKIVGAYHVTEDGKLLKSSASIKLTQPVAAEITFDGAVKDKLFYPKFALLIGGQDINPFALEPFAVSESGSILNPMHLVPKISGLREGRTWPVPLMDPLRAVPAALKDFVPVKIAAVQQVIATVTTEDRKWGDVNVPCFKIAYAKPGERPLAATWVRRSDDAVLEQWASYEGIEYTLQRAPGQ